MPTLQLKTSAPHKPPVPALYREVARELTAITASILGKRPEVTAVMIEEVPAMLWHVGAHPVQRTTFWLEISITAGTNTVAQKTAFVEAAFDALQRLLGDGDNSVEPASYVIVRELPATDWGYGAQTQAARRALAAAPAL